MRTLEVRVIALTRVVCIEIGERVQFRRGYKDVGVNIFRLRGSL